MAAINYKNIAETGQPIDRLDFAIQALQGLNNVFNTPEQEDVYDLGAILSVLLLQLERSHNEIESELAELQRQLTELKAG